MNDTPPDAAAPPRVLIAVAAAVAVALAVVVAVIGLSTGGQPPPRRTAVLPLPAVDAPQAGSPACGRLSERLPAVLPSAGRDLPRRRLADPAPRAAAAWGEPDPVVLRCGVGKPSQLTRAAKLRQVNGVRWLPVAGTGSTTWYAVDRRVYVALTVPDGSGTGPLQAVSDGIADALDARKPRP